MSPKLAYLTIDDAPSADTPRKVDYLVAKGIPAIWFCRGEFIEREREHARYIVEQGFVIGNHSYDHPRFSTLPLDQCVDQIARTDVLIDVVYNEAGSPRPAKAFRFPFGDKGGRNKAALQEYLRGEGYTQPVFCGIAHDWYFKEGLNKDVDVFWTYDTRDWKISKNSLVKVLGLMDEGLKNPGSAEIIVMHDFKRTTTWFEPMIEKLVEKGIAFASPGFTRAPKEKTGENT